MGKIPSPSISLLARKCLMNAGEAWNRMLLQLMNQKYERKIENEQEQQNQQNYQQRREFVQPPHNPRPQSIPTIRPPFVVEEDEQALAAGTMESS